MVFVFDFDGKKFPKQIVFNIGKPVWFSKYIIYKFKKNVFVK